MRRLGSQGCELLCDLLDVRRLGLRDACGELLLRPGADAGRVPGVRRLGQGYHGSLRRVQGRRHAARPGSGGDRHPGRRGRGNGPHGDGQGQCCAPRRRERRPAGAHRGDSRSRTGPRRQRSDTQSEHHRDDGPSGRYGGGADGRRTRQDQDCAGHACRQGAAPGRQGHPGCQRLRPRRRADRGGHHHPLETQRRGETAGGTAGRAARFPQGRVGEEPEHFRAHEEFFPVGDS